MLMSEKSRKDLAEGRIIAFFKNAGKCCDAGLAKKYIKKAKGAAMHFNIKLPKELRKKFCRKCFAYLTSKNSTIRVKRGFVAVKCLDCSTISRYKAA